MMQMMHGLHEFDFDDIGYKLLLIVNRRRFGPLARPITWVAWRLYGRRNWRLTCERFEDDYEPPMGIFGSGRKIELRQSDLERQHAEDDGMN